MFKGCLPYDAQYVGSFQPLLGWRSETNKTWIARQAGAALNALLAHVTSDNHKVKDTAFKGGLLDTGPEMLYDNCYKLLRSVAMIDGGIELKKLLAGLDAKKAAPNLNELIKLFENTLSAKSLVLQAKDKKGSRKVQDSKKVDQMQTFLSRKQDEIKVILEILSTLKNIGYLQKALQTHSMTYQKALSFIGKLISSTPPISREEGFRLSPIGLLNLYRHYFYDFGTFLGPPIEHIWVAPRSETELIEMWSQTSYRFRESETSAQYMEATEEAVAEANELSEEMQRRNEQDFKTGFTTSFKYAIAVVEGTGSLSMEYGMHLTNDKKTMRKNSRELSSKVATEMKRSVRFVTRESLETRMESTRRHLIKNATDDLISFEMRRKMRKVGIQAQHLGTQLCWQLILEEPGKNLGLAELVHVAKPEDFDTLPPPDIAPPSFETITEDYQFTIPFSPVTGADDNDEFYDGVGDGIIRWQFSFAAPTPQPGYMLTAVVEKTYERTDPEHDAPSLWDLEYRVTDGERGQFLVLLRSVNFEKQPSVRVTAGLTWQVKEDVRSKADLEYKAKMDKYEQQKQREAQTAIIKALRERVNLARSIVPRPSEDLREEERTELYRRALSCLLGPELSGEALFATSDLIRTWFEVEKMLYFVAPDWWKPRKVNESKNLPYMTEEIPFETGYTISGGDVTIILSIKGIVVKSDPNSDVIMYRYTCTSEQGSYSGSGFTRNPKNPNQSQLSADFRIPAGNGGGLISTLIPNPYYQVSTDPVKGEYTSSLSQTGFSRDQPKRENNYLITEESEPAPLGSSIGWTAQLDGDAHRNAFLNAAWARVVIPIRRGREKAAIDWLRQQHIEGSDGLNDALLDEDGKPVQKKDAHGNPVTDGAGNPVFKTVGEGLAELIAALSTTADDKIYIESQKVYENGFNPLPGGFQPGPNPLEVFAQWVEVVPTNQAVPVKYEAS